MAFRFKLGEPFEEGCKHIAREQIERAQSQLRDIGDQAVAVHETRKSLKRLRALLRLIRPAIGEDTFKQENAQLRQIGLSLSGARDRHVLLETVNKLEAAGGLGRKGLAQTLRRSLLAANGEGAPVDGAAMKQAHSLLNEAKKRLARLRIAGSGFDIVGPGLEACYRGARRAFRSAYDEKTDEDFHEWRKGAKHHWRQMPLLSRAWHGYLGARASEARNLSQVLGDDHDLALLVAFVRSDAAAGITGEQAAVPMPTWIDMERETPAGYVAGTEFPGTFAHLVSGYAAGYYGYMWSEVLALDMLSAFGNNLLDPKVGKRYRDTILAEQFAPVDVERPAFEPIALGLVLSGRRRARAIAPQHGANARNELAAAERLGQIIVGAHFQSDHPIDLVALGGEHDDRNIGIRAQRTAQRQPVLVRQHQVEQDEVDPRIGQHLAHGLAVAGGTDTKAFPAERARHQIAHLAMVVDDQDVRAAIHAPNLVRAGPFGAKKL